MPLGEFAKNKTRKDGLANWCKQCNKAYKATYCQANKKKIAEHRAEYYLTHREDELKKMAQYRQANREVLLQKQAEYYQANKDTILQKAAEYRANHKEAIAQKKAEWYAKNKDKKKAYMKAYTDPILSPLGWAKHMVRHYKQMDRDRGFDDSKTITAEWFVQNIMYKPCAHCGLRQVGAIGVNRLKNTEGHIPSNCEPCCSSCNARENIRDQLERGIHMSCKHKKQSFSSFVEEHKAKDKNLT